MFKIESYITSIILANADRYIRNFRKQDAQVSLWEGEATFHNIDLNVEALNEEFQTPFLVMSGYIHDLIIHVPWTKLVSEPVTITVNTIECVMRLRTKEERVAASSRSRPSKIEDRSVEQSPSSSYTSALTSKIMNNLSIRCENVILKVVEEDIVFSMNIEKLQFDNVNESWVPAMIDLNVDKLQTRKLITLSGLTICLDKQNSSGRIETYMEPLLYRCLIHIRLLRGYHRGYTKCPVYFHFDILSEKMSFTFSEPQIPMLLKLLLIILGSDDEYTTHQRDCTLLTGDALAVSGSTDALSEVEANANDASWSNWLWNMVPAILPQDEGDVVNQQDINPTYHVGFCIKNLELNIKVWNNRPKNKMKQEFRTILESKLVGCFYQMMTRSNEWFNVQFGVNYISIDIPTSGSENRINQVIRCGEEKSEDFSKETLFNDNFEFAYVKMHRKVNMDVVHNSDEGVGVEDKYDFMYNIEFSLDAHLNFLTEKVLLERSSAFAIDYVKSSARRTASDIGENRVMDGRANIHHSDIECEIEKPKKSVLLRLILNTSVTKITSDFLNRITYLHKIISSSEILSYHETNSGLANQRCDQKVTYKTQFVLFNLSVEFHVPSTASIISSSSRKDCKFSDIPESFSSCHSTPIFSVFCKRVDGKVNTSKNMRIIDVKTAELLWSLIQSNRTYTLIQSENLEWKSSKNLDNRFLDVRVDLRNILFKSSKPNILLAYYISNYLLYTFWHSDERNIYYSRIFFSSLIDDVLIPDNVVLELNVETLTCTHQSFKETYAYGFSVNRCKAYANKVTNDISKRILIFTVQGSETVFDPIKLRLQRSKNTDEECSYPNYIEFVVENIKLCLDPIIYSWLNYKPIPNVSKKPVSKTNKSIKDSVLTKSAPSRKVSDASSGSHGRKHGGSFPKPKESIHSSGEPEIQSPIEGTETDPSDTFQISDITPLPKVKKTFLQYVASELHNWCTYAIHARISSVTVYLPTIQTESNLSEDCDLERTLIDTLRKNSSQNISAGVLVFLLNSLKVKCDFPSNLFDELNSNVLLSVHKNVWSVDKLTTPWDVSIKDVRISSLSAKNSHRSLLKPFSADCSVGVSFRNLDADDHIATLCVHFHFQPLFADLTKRQVSLVSSAVDLLNSLLYDSGKCDFMAIAPEELCSRSPSTDTTERDPTRKLTGWIQWTFTKCSLNIYHENGLEMAKLSVETEDSIVSLEFDDVFHKFKIKLATFGIYHHVKFADSSSWSSGPFCGAVIQRSYSQPFSAVKTAEDDIDDRFLSVTITRARSSNLNSRLSSNACSDIQIPLSCDRYVTEVIFDISPIDVIVPFSILNKFVSVLKPLINRSKVTSGSDAHLAETRNEHVNAFPSLPLIYLNVPVLRIFVPLSDYSTTNSNPNFDTVICEMCRIVVDCQPKNPILRKESRSKTFQSPPGKRYAAIEQKSQGQQYQLFSESVSVKTGSWLEIEQIIFREQSLVKEPPSVLEKNPAVMWNMGFNPGNDKNDQNNSSCIISNFTCHAQFAPSVRCYSLRTTIQGPHLEVNILTDLEVTISLPQLCLLTALYDEYVRLILAMFTNEEEGNVSPVRLEVPCYRVSSKRTNDSGIESLEQNSVSSSIISKSKSEAQTPNVHHSTSKLLTTSASLSHASNIYKSSSTLASKKVIFEDVFITAPKINIILFNQIDVELPENDIAFANLFLFEVVQPSIWFSNENGYRGIQVEIFNASIRMPDLSAPNITAGCAPSRANFPLQILDARKTNYEPYSKIPFACFTFKMLQNMRKRWKVECAVEQPLFVNCELKIIHYVFSVIEMCSEQYRKYSKLFDGLKSKPIPEKKVSTNGFTSRTVYDSLNFLSSLEFRTSRLVFVFESTEAAVLLNTDSVSIHVKPPSEMRTQNESIFLLSEINSIAISLPKIQSKCLSDVLAKDDCFKADAKKHDFLSNLILQPWSMKVEIALNWHRTNSFSNRPSKSLKINSETISFNVSHDRVEKFSKVMTPYFAEYKKRYPGNRNGFDNVNEVIENDVVESYKDDLRAGAFQYIKVDEDKIDLPSPYEVFFCNRRIHPFMCWKYPQPRYLTKLQIYPLLIDDSNDEFVENKIRCQLQYYDEMTQTYEAYVAFHLCENTIQSIPLPNEKPRIIAAECWRVILFDFVDSHISYDIKMDIKSLVGYVRVDSVSQPSFVPVAKMLVNVSELQFHFYISCENESMAIDDYFMDYIPSEQCFLSVACNDVKIAVSDFRYEKVIKLSGIGKANMLNYEYLMLQSFIDPFSSEALIHYATDSTWKLATKMKTIHIRISPQFVHTLSMAQSLWDGWRTNVSSLRMVTTPYIICNNTNQLIMFRQENTSREIHLSPNWCHLFAWSNPAVPKLLRLSVFCGRKQYTSEPFGIGSAFSETVICKNEEGENCTLSITVAAHSSVVFQVVIRGSLLAYNLSQSEIDMCIISHGKKMKNKLSSAQVVSASTLAKRRLLSLVLPLEHQLVFKIRFAPSQNDVGPAQWSGLISLKTTLKGSNQTSWLVKIPLRNHKEHFQSVWCQLTCETDQEFPCYLVVFHPLCSVVSFFPSDTHFKISNELGTAIDDAVSSEGRVTDLLIPDTVSLDKYSVECRSEEKCLITTQLEATSKHQNNEAKFYSIQSLLADIEASFGNDDRWLYSNIEGTNLPRTTDQSSENGNELIMKVFREERFGCGTRIELYPWAIITNLLDHKIILATSNAVYPVKTKEMLAPPLLEGTFKIGLVENENNFLSGSLQLADDQSFPIPKVSGRIPMNGFVTTMIDCDNHVSFVNITSKSHKEMRIISICSSYVINNKSSLKIGYSAWVICRSGSKSSTSFDLPLSLENKSIYLTAKGADCAGQSITKWFKMGTGDVQMLPYLILTVDGNVACPVRICDLSEKQRYPVVFSNGNSSEASGPQLPSVFMTAQQSDGQVFLTLWDEAVPQITIHNMSELSLNVVASRSESGNKTISCSVDWNWKFKVSAKCSAHFHTQNHILEQTKKQSNEFLMFAVESRKHVKQTKWSSGVSLAPCVNQLITLPLSQHHIKLAIFRNGFTFVVWIESATADELSAKMIRARLSESFLPINEGAVIPLANEDSDVKVEDDLEVPDQLKRMYNTSLLKPISTNIFVEEICVTLAGDDELTLDENDIVTFCAKNVYSNLISARKPNEIIPDILCHMSVDEYQLDNDEYCFRAYDFPVVLMSHRSTTTDSKYPLQQHVDDLLLNLPDDSTAALKLNVYFTLDRNFTYNIREVELNLGPLNVYLEDKYLSKLKDIAEKMISAVMNSFSLTVRHCQRDENVESALAANNERREAKAPFETVKVEETTPEIAISTSSKSVNLSEECEVDEKTALAVGSPQTFVESDIDTQEQSLENSTKCAKVDECSSKLTSHSEEDCNCVLIPLSVIKRSKLIARPIRLRAICISSMHLTVSVHTSTTFYIALDRSPLKFSEFKKQFLVMTPFELGNVLVLHYFFGAIYGTGWAISSLEFVGSPGVLARNLGTGVMDFISMPIYGISSGPRGLVLGIAHGSASLMKHIMAGTLSSVTNFAGSWARTLNRFTLDADDLLQSEHIRRIPPSNVTEGILQGLAEFGISLLGGISGIAHHPLQYAASNPGASNRSLFNSISLGLVGVLTRPLSGAAELVAKTGQGIMSHVGWNTIPAVRKGSGLSYGNNNAGLQICNLKFEWKREYERVILSIEGVKAENIASSIWIILTDVNLHVVEANDNQKRWVFPLQTHEFYDQEEDPTLICIQRPILNFKTAEDFSRAQIYKFINETNECFNIKSSYTSENALYLTKTANSFAFCVNPQIKKFLLSMISFVQKMDCSNSDKS